ncbi:MAG: hypothetical protein CMF41_06330 [Legionellales bacterium]|nr:hypothetical protein [Legionellales bacterium]
MMSDKKNNEILAAIDFLTSEEKIYSSSKLTSKLIIFQGKVQHFYTDSLEYDFHNAVHVFLNLITINYLRKHIQYFDDPLKQSILDFPSLKLNEVKDKGLLRKKQHECMVAIMKQIKAYVAKEKLMTPFFLIKKNLEDKVDFSNQALSDMFTEVFEATTKDAENTFILELSVNALYAYLRMHHSSLQESDLLTFMNTNRGPLVFNTKEPENYETFLAKINQYLNDLKSSNVMSTVDGENNDEIGIEMVDISHLNKSKSQWQKNKEMDYEVKLDSKDFARPYFIISMLLWFVSWIIAQIHALVEALFASNTHSRNSIVSNLASRCRI